MKPSPLDLELLAKNVLAKNLSFVKNFVSQFGKSYLEISQNKYGPQELYADCMTYYPIHVAIINNDLPMLEYFHSIGIISRVRYLEESNFNSKADQYMTQQSFSIVEVAVRHQCSKDVLDFLNQWIAKN